MLISHGTSSQELRIVTTVGTGDEGERVMEELNSMLILE
jgi:hypothetical protein